MNHFQTIIITSFLLSMTATLTFAQKNGSVRLKDFFIGKNEQSDSVTLKFLLVIPPHITKANDELLLTPILTDNIGNRKFSFPTARICSNKRIKSIRRKKILHASEIKKHPKDNPIDPIGNQQSDTLIYITRTSAEEPWVWQAKLVLHRLLRNCCTEKELEPIELQAWNRPEEYAPLKPQTEKIKLPEIPGKSLTEILDEQELFVEPIDNYHAGKKILAGEQEGGQIIYFKLGKAEIDNDYLDNRNVLKHIVDVARQINEDPEAEIACIVLLGLSSPEGTFEFNKQLSGKRAEALKQYMIERIVLPDSCFVLVNGDEGWDELRYQVAHSDMPERDAVLKIIDTVPILGGRESQLMRLKQGIPYRYLKKEFFPQLRRASYIKVYYRMKNKNE